MLDISMLSQTSCFDFSSSNFHLQGHILSTSGVALKRKNKVLKTLIASSIPKRISFREFSMAEYGKPATLKVQMLENCYGTGLQSKMQDQCEATFTHHWLYRLIIL